jgi:hypothetical protein
LSITISPFTAAINSCPSWVRQARAPARSCYEQFALTGLRIHPIYGSSGGECEQGGAILGKNEIVYSSRQSERALYSIRHRIEDHHLIALLSVGK